MRYNDVKTDNEIVFFAVTFSVFLRFTNVYCYGNFKMTMLIRKFVNISVIL